MKETIDCNFYSLQYIDEARVIKLSLIRRISVARYTDEMVVWREILGC